MKIIEIRPNGSKRVLTLNDRPSMTDQQFKKDCDINHIWSKYTKTGQINHLAKNRGRFADVSEIPDLPTALMQVNEAAAAFAQIPAVLRKRFGNDPAEFIAYLQNPENMEESIKLGLRSRKDESEKPPREASNAIPKKTEPPVDPKTI